MAKRAPKKYADRERTQITPEWKAWREEQENTAEDDYYELASAGFDPDTYFPGENEIPEEGAWILVLEEPHTVLQQQFRVPLLSMWRARPHELNAGAVKLRGGRKIYPKQAVITTPAGDLHLWSHEYRIAANPLGLLSDPDATIHQLGGQPVLDEDHLFYLQSRGISRQDATMMLFEQITDTNFIYVTFPEEITELLRGVGTSLRSHVRTHPRGAVAA